MVRIHPLLIVGSIGSLILYGAVGLFVGLYATEHPCNHSVTGFIGGCTPGQNFGDFFYHVEYVDHTGQHRVTEYKSSTGNCLNATNQHIELCYPLYKPYDVRIGDKVFLKNPRASKALLISGGICFAVGCFAMGGLFWLANQSQYVRMSNV